MPKMPSPPASRTLPYAVVTVAVCATVVVVGVGWADAKRDSGTTPPIASISSSPTTFPSAGRPDAAESRGTTPTPSSAPDEEKTMRIEITIGQQRFQATLSESAAARDLVAQLPVTINMTDHGAVEKTGPLLSPLSLDGQPDGADPEVGDVGYYAPGNALVLYYGDQSYYPGIVILGKLEDDAAQRISDSDGPVTATVEARGA
jgi:hypothetical protein